MTNVSVMILNDDFVEAIETFDLSITSVSSTATASVGLLNSSSVSITDNDGELITNCYICHHGNDL